MLSNTLRLLFCGNNAEGSFTITLSAGVSMQAGFDNKVAVISEVFPSISSSTFSPFSVARKCFNASLVKDACFLHFRNRSNAAIIDGSYVMSLMEY